MSKGSPLGVAILGMALLKVVLHRYATCDDLTLATWMPAAGPMPGNIVVCRTRLASHVTLAAAIDAVKVTVQEALAHGLYPYEALRERLRHRRVLLSDDVPNALFCCASLHVGLPPTPQLPFRFTIDDVGDDGAVSIAHPLDPEHAPRLQRLLAAWAELLAGFSDHVTTPLAKLPVIPTAERQQILALAASPAAWPTEATISSLFDLSVRRHPTRTAVSYEGHSLTYAELDRRATQLAAKLRDAGAGPDSMVALLVERSLDLVTTIVGVVKSGAAYVPIDPDLPEDRIRFILEDCGARLVVASRPSAALMAPSAQFFLVDDPAIWRGEISALPRVDAPRDLLYVIYTSGTTGRPKGVLIEHRHVVRLLFNDHLPFRFEPTDTWTLFHSYAFDFSVWEMYGALLTGGHLVVVPKMTTRNPAAFLELLERERVTVLNQTPSAFYGLIHAEHAQTARADALRYVIFGGEALDPRKLADWHRRYPEVALINMYGITETTVHVTYKEIGDADIESGLSNIGRAIPTSSTYIVDEQLDLVPRGAPGELCVGGEGVARGYLHRDELTASRFVPSPFVPGERLYRSGDLVRLLESGDLEYLGRIDEQVKVRGFRIETGEVEARLETHPAIARAVVVARTDATETYLCAYFELADAVPAARHPQLIDELRAHAARFLPDYMVPAHFVALDRIPLTPNGKLDRAALPEPLSPAPPAASAVAFTPVETKLRGIWDAVIGAGHIAADRSFFEAGGDSIRAIRLVGLVNDAFGTQLRIPDLYAHHTLAGLSALLAATAATEARRDGRAALEAEFARLKDVAADFLDVAPLDDVYPASDIEHAMLYHALQEPRQAIYHDQLLYQLSIPNFDVDRLQHALVLLAGKHCVLRSRYVLDSPDGPLHLVETHPRVIYRHRDLLDLDAREQSLAINAWLARDRARPFVPHQAPLWRMQSFACGHDRVVLVLVAHHAILDGWSAALFMRELDTIYRHLQLQPDFRPTRLRSRHREHVLQQRLDRDRPEAAAFWCKELRDFVPQGRFARAASDDGADVGVIRHQLSTSLASSTRTAANVRGSSVKTLCLSAYLMAISMFHFHADLLVGLVTHDRPMCLDGDHLLGCFLNTVPFRMRMPADASWAELVDQVGGRLRAIGPYERWPLTEILRVAGGGARDGNPFFSTFFNYTDFGDDSALLADSSRHIDAHGHVRTDMLLEFTVDATGGRLHLVVGHTPPAWIAADAQRLCTYFERALHLLVHEPTRRVSKLDVMGEPERQQVVATFNATDRDIALGPSVSAAFALQTARTPDRLAVVWDEGHLTYAQLAARAQRIAAVLRASGVVRETIVGLLVERSADMVAAVLGIIAAGGAYLPLDPEQPDGRIDELLAGAGVAHLVSTSADLAHRALSWLHGAGQPGDGTVRTLLALDRLDMAPEAPVPDDENGPHDLLYLISTSGSTGKPKCVMVEHFTMLNLAEFTRLHGGLPPVPKVLQLASIGFDVSAQEIVTTLLLGGELHLIPPAARRDVPRLLALIEHRGVQVVYLTPSLLDAFFADAEMAASVPACVRHFMAGGEALVVGPLLAMAVREGRFTLHDLYGPSETHGVIATTFPPGSIVPTRSPLGVPLPNCRIFVLDENGMTQPIGTAGEIHIGGRAVGRGYYGHDDLTRERYRRGLPDPTMPAALLPDAARTERVYRTGDLGCWNADGTVTYLGRLDHQIKIRGFRIELGEIEARLRHLAGIKEAVVLDHDDGARRRLVAYVVPQGGEVSSEDAARWRAELEKTLPSYMVPSRFIGRDAIPLTGNGKVDRRSLRAATTVDTPAPAPAPLDDPLAIRLAELWAATLGGGTAQLGAESDFFELGGHSLKAMTLAARIQRTFGIALPLTAIYERATLGAMTERVRAATRERHEPIAVSARQARYRVSPAQRRFFVLSALAPESLAYNLPLTVDLSGPLDAAAFERALARLVARHAALRSHFVLEDGELFQRIDDDVQPPFEVVDTTDDEVPQRIAAFVQPFDLGKPPLIRALLLRTGPERATLALDFHHIATDGVSTGILLRDLLKLYAGAILAPPRLQYTDYIAWLDAPARQEHRERSTAFWKTRLAGETPVLNLPTDRPRPPVRSTAGAVLHFTLSSEVTDAWRRLAREERASLFMVSLAAFHIFLSKLTGQDRTMIGTPVAGRSHADLEDIVGVFVNTLVLGNRIHPHQSFRTFLADVRQTTLAAFEHQEYPFEELVERLGVARNTARNPLFDAFLTLQNMDVSVPNDTGLKVIPREANIVTSKFDLSLYLVERNGELGATFEYATDLFRPETVARFARSFATLASGVAATPDAPIGTLSLVDDEDRALLHTWNSTTAQYGKDATVHGLFEQQAARRPTAAAVTFEGETLTYAELNARANRLARHLRSRGVGPDVLVGVCLERSLTLVVSLLAVMKAGGAYLPMDPSYPADRLRYLLEDAGARVVLVDRSTVSSLPADAGATQYVDPEARSMGDQDDSNPIGNVSGESLAYVIYTSGSTGKPKGAMNSHAGLYNRLMWMQATFSLGVEDVILQKTPFSFDVSVWEFFWPLMVGARLVVARPSGHQDTVYLAKLADAERVTVMHFVPSMLNAFLEEPSASRCHALRKVMASGEALGCELEQRFFERLPGVELHNLYGPTEASIDVSWWACDPWHAEPNVPIGRPIANVQLYVVDGSLSPVPVGVVGELLIGGIQLARGYLNRASLTAERFIPDSLSGAAGARLYRTGDLARYRADGALEYWGRMDHQVKVRGFRIELGEVETVMRGCMGIQDAVVTVRSTGAGDAILCGYYVTDEGSAGPAHKEALRAELAAALPEYMVPSQLVRMPSLPLTTSGKIDRQALPALHAAASEDDRSAYSAPRDPLEQAVASAWARALGTERIGLDDNFFDLGGTSLALIRLQGLLREALGREVPVATLFRFPTLRAQAAHLKAPPTDRNALPPTDIHPAHRSKLASRRRRMT